MPNAFYQVATASHRLFQGVILLILALDVAMWVFVKVHSAAMGGVDPDAALRRVKSYNAQAIGHQDRKAAVVSPAGRSNCAGARSGCSLKKM